MRNFQFNIKMANKLGLFLIAFIISETIITLAMIIPQDVEILDEYKINEPSSENFPSSDSSPSSSFLEAESLRNFQLTKAIRNKRSPLSSSYRVIESPGLLSHFHVQSEFDPLKYHHYSKLLEKNQNNEFIHRIKHSIFFEPFKRQKRSEKSEIEGYKNNETNKDMLSNESSSSSSLTFSNLPIAEKQVMEPLTEYYRKGGWNVQSYDTDYSKISRLDDDDEPISEATSNEGIRGRSPKVNFITQPKKNHYDEIKERAVLSKYSAQPLPLSKYERIQGPPYSSYPTDFYPSRSYDPYLRRYDRYDDQYNRYDPYYEDYYLYRRRYDPYDSYSPRTPSYPEPFYDYPDRRFDIPEPRSSTDYRPIYTNDLYYDRMPPVPSSSSAYNERNNRRIIYYAHLPEIVRTPPSVDLTYGSYGRDNRYDSNYGSSSSSSGTSGAYYRHHSDNNSNNNSNNSDVNKDYGFIKREKKDHRNYPPYQKKNNNGNNSNAGSSTSLKQDS